MSKQFKVKNRPKRKYTRHNVAVEHTYQSPNFLAGLLPTMILVIAFIAMLFINMHMREHTVDVQPEIQFSAPKVSTTDFLKPIQSFPNLILEPAAFFASLGIIFIHAVISTLNAFGSGTLWFISLLDPRPIAFGFVNGLESFFTGLGTTFVLIGTGLAQVGNLLVQSLVNVWVHFATGMQTIGALSLEYTVRAFHIIWTSLVFIFSGILWLLVTIFQFFATIILWIGAQISAVFGAIFHAIAIPFKILWALWLTMQPYVAILGDHVGMAGADLQNGFSDIGQLGTTLQR